MISLIVELIQFRWSVKYLNVNYLILHDQFKCLNCFNGLNVYMIYLHAFSFFRMGSTANQTGASTKSSDPARKYGIQDFKNKCNFECSFGVLTGAVYHLKQHLIREFWLLRMREIAQTVQSMYRKNEIVNGKESKCNDRAANEHNNPYATATTWWIW